MDCIINASTYCHGGKSYRNHVERNSDTPHENVVQHYCREYRNKRGNTGYSPTACQGCTDKNQHYRYHCCLILILDNDITSMKPAGCTAPDLTCRSLRKHISVVIQGLFDTPCTGVGLDILFNPVIMSHRQSDLRAVLTQEEVKHIRSDLTLYLPECP